MARRARAARCRDGGRRACVRAAAEAQHHRDHGRRHRLVQHRRLSPGHDGGPHAEPRQARCRGNAIHRLLCRGELHGGTGELHHRRIADPHRADHRRPGRRIDRHAGRGADHRHGAQVDGLCHRPVRQEPSGRLEPVPADRARLRRILRLSLSPRRHGGPLPSQLPAGAQGHRRSAQHGAQLCDQCGRSDGPAALGQDRQAADRGRRRTLSQTHGDRGRRDPERDLQVHRQGQAGRTSRSSSGSIRPACTWSRTSPRNTRRCGIRTTAGPSRKPAWRSSTTSSVR